MFAHKYISKIIDFITWMMAQSKYVSISTHFWYSLVSSLLLSYDLNKLIIYLPVISRDEEDILLNAAKLFVRIYVNFPYSPVFCR